MNEKGGDEEREGAADEVEVHHHDAVAIGVAREPDHVLRADVGDDHRHPRHPPGKRLPGEKEVLAGADPAARPQAERGDGDEIEDDERQVEDGELDRFHERSIIPEVRRLPFSAPGPPFRKLEHLRERADAAFAVDPDPDEEDLGRRRCFAS